MKFKILFCFLLLFIKSYSQVSSSATFRLVVKFEKKISVKDLNVSYCKKDGNSFEEVHITKDYKKNEITVYGSNHFIFYVTFPTLIFSQKSNIDDKQLKESPLSQHNYYLVASGRITSYTTKLPEIIFSKTKPIILVSQNKIGKKIKIEKMKDSEIENQEELKYNLSICNQLINITEKKQ